MASGGGNHVEHKANVNEKEKPIGDESRRHLFVCKVSNEASKESLTEFFQQYGEVQDVRLIYDKHTRAGCGFGFVIMRDEDGALRAVQDRPRPLMNGRRLVIEFANEQKFQHSTHQYKPLPNWKDNQSRHPTPRPRGRSLPSSSTLTGLPPRVPGAAGYAGIFPAPPQPLGYNGHGLVHYPLPSTNYQQDVSYYSLPLLSFAGLPHQPFPSQNQSNTGLPPASAPHGLVLAHNLGAVYGQTFGGAFVQNLGNPNALVAAAPLDPNSGVFYHPGPGQYFTDPSSQNFVPAVPNSALLNGENGNQGLGAQYEQNLTNFSVNNAVQYDETYGAHNAGIPPANNVTAHQEQTADPSSGLYFGPSYGQNGGQFSGLQYGVAAVQNSGTVYYCDPNLTAHVGQQAAYVDPSSGDPYNQNYQGSNQNFGSAYVAPEVEQIPSSMGLLQICRLPNSSNNESSTTEQQVANSGSGQKQSQGPLSKTARKNFNKSPRAPRPPAGPKSSGYFGKK